MTEFPISWLYLNPAVVKEKMRDNQSCASDELNGTLKATWLS